MKHQRVSVCLQEVIKTANFGYLLTSSTVWYLFLVKVVLIFHHTTIFQLLSMLTGQQCHNGCGQLSSQHGERHTIYTMSLFIDNVIDEVHIYETACTLKQNCWVLFRNSQTRKVRGSFCHCYNLINSLLV